MKHIVIIIDGTGNSATRDKHYSNAYKINTLINNYCSYNKYGEKSIDEPQIAFYVNGPAVPLSLSAPYKLHSYYDLIFGYSIDSIISQQYLNICSNYVEGDKIYIFGYSRGAIAACILSHFISHCGLLAPEFVNRYESLKRIFTNYGPLSPEFINKLNYKIDAMRRISKNERLDSVVHIPSPEIEFVGLFDPVFGPNFAQKILEYYWNIDLSTVPRNVNRAISILAIDEQYSLLSPLIWNKQNTSLYQYVEQIWIPGSHSDIGGTSKNYYLGIVSLLTMIHKMKNLDLELHRELFQSYYRLLNARKIRKDISIQESARRISFLIPKSFRKITPTRPENGIKDIRPNETKIKTTIHPIYKKLLSRKILINDQFKIYKSKNFYKKNANFFYIDNSDFMESTICSGTKTYVNSI